MRQLAASIGGRHNAKVTKTWSGSWPAFVKALLSRVPETDDKSSNGWVCGATFDPPYRDSENFQHRHFVSLDYDHITPSDSEALLGYFAQRAFFAYTTWSYSDEKPRLRVWLPLSRPVGYDEFQAISRRVAADAPGGIELAARESHVPAQYMFRPAIKPFGEFRHWENLEGPWIQVDEVLASYAQWTDRTSWPHRAEGDGVHSEGTSESPLEKPGIIGAFNRAYGIRDAIQRFGLPYTTQGASDGDRLTYAQGSRPDGVIIYDNDTKIHSHHDTDPARGQNNAYDLVRLHLFGDLDWLSEGLPLSARASSVAMAEYARNLSEVRAQLVAHEGFEDLDATDFDWLADETGPVAGPVVAPGALPEKINPASSKLTDQENARRIQRRYGDRILSIGKAFYCWTGTHWQKDDSPVLRLITKLSKIVEAEAIQYREKIEAEGRALTDEEEAQFGQIWKWSVDCGQAARLNACESLLRRLLSFDAKLLNTNHDLFNCANGTLNLRTGELKPHDPKDFITACSPVAYDANAEAPRFMQFLHEIHQDPEVVGFVQRWFGYCMTGHVLEHAVVFHVGQGGNGKGTTMTLLDSVLGEGYYSAAPQKLLNLDEAGATPEVAGLLGRRMVTISETDESLQIRDGLVKKLTGGDKLSARHLFKDPFEFLPTHKLQIFTNHAPVIKSQEFSMWRRIILLNYNVQYGDPADVEADPRKKLKDRGLDAALAAEKAGVLRWLVDGARQWFNGGLKIPPAVAASTQKYREDQDVMGAFARERLTADDSAWTALSGRAESVFPAYRAWCSAMNHRPLGRQRFIGEVLRVMKGAKLEARREGNTLISGFSGFSLTNDLLDD